MTRSCSGSRRRIRNTKIIGGSLAAAPYGMEINKAHPEFVRFVNGVLAKLRADGTWRALYDKWLGRHPRSRTPLCHRPSTTADMKLDDLDRELERLREASERVAANLVELEIDSSRQLLEACTLTGESAARWSTASAALTDLWEWRGLLERFLERAHELRRSPRHANELQSFISGPSIELARSQVPLAERDLLGASEVTVRCTADELFERMSGAFDGVKTVVAEFGQAWDTLTPRLTAARGVLDQTQRTRGFAGRVRADRSERGGGPARQAERGAHQRPALGRAGGRRSVDRLARGDPARSRGHGRAAPRPRRAAR